MAMHEKQDFFEEINLLQVGKSNVQIEKKVSSFAEALDEYANDNYIAVVHCVNEIKFGYYKNKQFYFADDKSLEEKYILQARLFNQDKELLLQRKENTFLVRFINDNSENDYDNKNEMEYVDSKSPLFGDRDTKAKLPQGFVRLVEKGRKLSMIIPTDEVAKKYLLKTRSYIGYDEKTGQAGYKFWRYLALEAR